MTDTIVGFDVGNSTVKAGWFDNGPVRDVRTTHHQSTETIRAFVDRALAEKRFGLAIVATVNSAASDRLLKVLSERSITVLDVLTSDGRLFDLGIIGCGVKTPRTTGVDRLLATIAAQRLSPNQNVLVVTCGSAITVNLTTSDGVFRGGAILPGLGMMARSLHSDTAALPQIAVPEAQSEDQVRYDWSNLEFPGTSTVAAIRSGIFFAAVGAIERLVAEAARQLGSPPVVHITGGDGEILCRSLNCPNTFSPCLVLDGLREVASMRQS